MKLNFMKAVTVSCQNTKDYMVKTFVHIYRKRWDLLRCDTCGSSGMHMRCGGIDGFVDEWICEGCAEVTGKTNIHIRQQKLLDLSSSGSSEIDTDEGRKSCKIFRGPIFDIVLKCDKCNNKNIIN